MVWLLFKYIGYAYISVCSNVLTCYSTASITINRSNYNLVKLIYLIIILIFKQNENRNKGETLRAL